MGHFGTCPIISGVQLFVILLIDIVNTKVRKRKRISKVKFSDEILHKVETSGTSRLAERVTFSISLSPYFL